MVGGENDTQPDLPAIPIPVEGAETPTAPTAFEPPIVETLATTTGRAHTALERVPEIMRPERTLNLRRAPSDQPVTVREIIGGKLNPSRPKPGLVRYLAFDLSIPEFHKNPDKAIKEFESVKRNSDFHICLMEGHLVIMASHERANNSLQAIAKSLEKVCPSSKVIVGSANIKYSGFEDVTVEGITEALTDNEWTKQPAGTYVTEEFADALADPTSRESTLCELELDTPTTKLNLRKVLKYTPKVSSQLGGPDRLIGNKIELRTLQDTLEDEENRLTYLVGPAGIGKTRLLLEILANGKTPYVHCSLDAGDKGYPGHSLVTLAIHLGGHFTKGQQNPLAKFSEQALSDQRDEAEIAPESLAEKCLDALNELVKTKGENMLFILEDFHNADPHSQPWLKYIASKYIGDKKGVTRKALLTMRPKEIYEFEAQKQLKTEVQKFHGERAFKQVELNTLDLENGMDAETNEPLSYQYAYYSLDPNLRKNKVLGQWHTVLGKASGGIPFQMDYLIVRAKNNLKVGEKVIDLETSTLERIGKISPTDTHAFAVYYRERIQALSGPAGSILLAVALLGGKVAQFNIEILARKLFEREREKQSAYANLITELQEGGFMVMETDNEGKKNWRIQNETLTEFAINSVSPEQAAMYSGYVHGLLAYAMESDSDAKLKIMSHIACAPNTEHLEIGFWDQFAETAQRKIKQAEDNNAPATAYNFAKNLLDAKNGSPILITAAEKLQQNKKTDEPEIPQSQQKLAVTLLMAIAKNALYLGRFADSEKALEDLLKIQAKHPELIDITELALVEYEKAYQKIETKLMGTIYGDDIENSEKISKAEKAVAKLKLDYRRRDYQTLYTDYQATEEILNEENESHKAQRKGMPSPNYIEALRLVKVMAPYDQWKRSIKALPKNKVSDDNLDYMPETLTEDQKKALKEIRKELTDIEAQKAQYPSILNPFSALYLAFVKAEILAYSGERHESIDCAAENWRIAEQMHLPELSARMAQFIGKIQIHLGFPEMALDNFNTRGAISTEQLPKDNFYRWVMRIERLWAIGQTSLREIAKLKNGKLNETQQAQQKAKMQELLPQAFEEFSALNKLAASQKKDPVDKIGKGQIAYYALGYIKWIWTAAQYFGVSKPPDIHDEKKYPFLSLETLDMAEDYSEKVSDETLPTTDGPKSIRREAWIKKTSIKAMVKAKRESLARK